MNRLSIAADSGRPTPSAQLAAYLRSAPQPAAMRRRPLEEIRCGYRDWALAVGGTPECLAAVVDVDAGGVPARLYQPKGDERDVLVWFHGGAWMLGELDGTDRIARALARRSGAAVLTVDYRLAPEHRFPAAIDDAWTAAAWAAGAFEQLAVGGDSAGGNLAAVVALRARDHGLDLALQVLVYPLVACAVETADYLRYALAYADFAGRPGFGAISHDNLRYMWDTYVPAASDRLLPDAAPMRAPTLTGNAPAILLTAEHDILRHDAQQYARWLRAEGVPVEIYDYLGETHGFLHMLGILDAAHDAADRCAAALSRAFGRPRER